MCYSSSSSTSWPVLRKSPRCWKPFGASGGFSEAAYPASGDVTEYRSLLDRTGGQPSRAVAWQSVDASDRAGKAGGGRLKQVSRWPSACRPISCLTGRLRGNQKTDHRILGKTTTLNSYEKSAMTTIHYSRFTPSFPPVSPAPPHPLPGVQPLSLTVFTSTPHHTPAGLGKPPRNFSLPSA